jgi:predicted cupin superfamily sugar epimerase
MAANLQEQLIHHLHLQPHPEGGFYREVYRSEERIPSSALAAKYTGERNVCTSIYFMLTAAAFSAFHRIQQDEIWHFYQGAPIHLHILSPEGKHTLVKVGHDFEAGEVPQVVVPAQHWFAAAVALENSFSLVGCTVAPGFDFADFELADRATLTKTFPQHHRLIENFTRL